MMLKAPLKSAMFGSWCDDMDFFATVAEQAKAE
jgi:hypothetical protein